MDSSDSGDVIRAKQQPTEELQRTEEYTKADHRLRPNLRPLLDFGRVVNLNLNLNLNLCQCQCSSCASCVVCQDLRDEGTTLIQASRVCIFNDRTTVFSFDISGGLRKCPEESWLVGKLRLLPKSGDLSNPNNWRGITLLAVIAKLVCSVLSNRMTSHMQVIGLEAQCGFMPGKSTIDAGHLHHAGFLAEAFQVSEGYVGAFCRLC